MRPDDLAAQMVQAVLEKVPALDPRDIDDLIMGCGQPAGEAGYNIARVVAVQLLRLPPGTTVNRYCSSSLQTTRMAFHAIKAGEGDAFISAGVETVSRSATAPPTAGRTARIRSSPMRRRAPPRPPRVRRSGTTRARTGCCPTSTSPWARPPRTSRPSPGSAAKTRTIGCALAEPRRGSHQERLLRA
nr:hypothetical protein [Mycolicibacterium duvalii]